MQTPPLCFCCEKSKQNQIEQERKEKKGENSWIPAHSKFCQEFCKVGYVGL
jgi:hypothetical protein